MFTAIKSIFTAIVLLGFCPTLFADTLKADFRHRPPEMIINSDGQFSGPLKDIIEVAAQQLGHTIEWRNVPFPRSLVELQSGSVDIVPRAIRTTEREAFIRFVGPISEQTKNIIFVTKKNGPAINSYDELKNINIGVKRDTVYFDKFDHDQSLKKTIVNDDFNLARMLDGGRIDAIVVLDLPALEAEFKSIKFSDYNQAAFSYPNKIGNYYGMPKTHPQADALEKVLLEMVKNGKVAEIYAKFGLTAQ